MRHLLSIESLSPADMKQILSDTAVLKRERGITRASRSRAKSGQ
jgi:ornithine carbamoyltransferase